MPSQSDSFLTTLAGGAVEVARSFFFFGVFLFFLDLFLKLASFPKVPKSTTSTAFHSFPTRLKSTPYSLNSGPSWTSLLYRGINLEPQVDNGPLRPISHWCHPARICSPKLLYTIVLMHKVLDFTPVGTNPTQGMIARFSSQLPYSA